MSPRTSGNGSTAAGAFAQIWLPLPLAADVAHKRTSKCGRSPLRALLYSSILSDNADEERTRMSAIGRYDRVSQGPECGAARATVRARSANRNGSAGRLISSLDSDAGEVNMAR